MSCQSVYTPTTAHHVGYTPLRTHYAFGAVSGLGSQFHRDPHQSYASYTPVARISPPYAYVRPQSVLSARFEYNYPTAYISKSFIADTAADDNMPLRASSLTRSHSGCGGWTALACMGGKPRGRCYPATDYAREPAYAVKHQTMKTAAANVDRLEFERLNAKVATLEADKQALRDKVDTLERDLKFKQMDLDALRGGSGEANPETERELKSLRNELRAAKEVEQSLRADMEAAQSQGGGGDTEGDLDQANAELASLRAIKEKLESDMRALQEHMVEAIEDLAKPSEGELASNREAAPKEEEFFDAPPVTEEAGDKPADGKKPFLKGKKTKQ